MNKKSHKNSIVEVYEENFLYEIKRIGTLIEKYNFVSMDTEFPGTVYQMNSFSKDIYYKTIKINVDNLKMIQVGMTLCDQNGEFPEGNATWQFNLKFDMKVDKFSYESIALLTNSGIDFDVLENSGIPHNLFAEYLTISGLVLNDNIHWISFHGSYDFAYLMKILSGNLPLPENEISFLENCETYFQNFYDIRYLVRNRDHLKGGLNKLSQELEVVRIGATHQAGSDSIVTAEVFFRLFKNSYIDFENLKEDRNVLFGLGEGFNEETYLYTNYNNNNFSNVNINFNNSNGMYIPNGNIINPMPTNNGKTQGYPNSLPNQMINNPHNKNNTTNVIYPYITNNNITYNTVYNYNMPPQILNNANITGIPGTLNNNINNNVYNFQPVTKTQEKKKNFGKVLEGYSS